MSLTDIIIDKIKAQGPLSFHDFMEMSLYYPGLGYYTSSCNSIGPCGDYYTSSGIGALFGAMVGIQLEEMWALLGREPFTIVEYGAGHGFLCSDILNELKANRELYDNLNYCIIEKSPAMKERAKTHLPDKVSWYRSINEIRSLNGCILSNELLDNFSVHRVVMDEELMEVFVDYQNDSFTEILQPAGAALKNYFEELNVVLPQGFHTEVNLDAINWLRDIAEPLARGYVMTIDYGYPSAELYRSHRHQGTLMCYRKHKVNNQPYTYIGEQDITAHVNFSALHHWGLKNGLNCCGLSDQVHFLLSLGLEDYLNSMREQNPQRDPGKESFLLHTLLVDMGTRFKVLIQQKGMTQQPLSGLKFSRLYNTQRTWA